jgi:hypothetical protein
MPRKPILRRVENRVELLPSLRYNELVPDRQFRNYPARYPLAADLRYMRPGDNPPLCRQVTLDCPSQGRQTWRELDSYKTREEYRDEKIAVPGGVGSRAGGGAVSQHCAVMPVTQKDNLVRLTRHLARVMIIQTCWNKIRVHFQKQSRPVSNVI